MAEDATLQKRIDDLCDGVVHSLETLRTEMNTRFAEMLARFDDHFSRHSA